MNGISRIMTLLLAVYVGIGMGACTSTQLDMRAANDEDKDIGLGGTGLLANSGSGLGGTGILGEITGFGSIFVNGIEIEYDSKTPLTVNGETATHQQLAVGDVVEVLTTDANTHTHAQMINLRHEVIGRVEAVNTKASSFTVLGQTVIQTGNQQALPEVGAAVAVSGFRTDDHTIQATRVAPAESKHTLLRRQTDLPFNRTVTRWRVQTHVQHGKATLGVEGARHDLLLQQKPGGLLNDRSGINILELHKPMSGQLKIERVIDSEELPRGQLTPVPVQRHNNMMQRPMPMHMNTLPNMNRGGR